jgi:hypothetical protein
MTCPLDFLPLHPQTKLWSPSQEELVVVRARVGPLRKSPKSIQVQLSLEGSQLGLSEVSGPLNSKRARNVRRERDLLGSYGSL